MQSHLLKRTHKNKKSFKVGRGGKHAKTAGRGTKGQNARAGRKKRPELRDFIKRFPKLRGRGKNINTSVVQKPFGLSLSVISKNFNAGDIVTTAALAQKGMLKLRGGKVPAVKVLAGATDKKLSFSGIAFSASAKAAVEKAGGNIA